MKRKFKILDDGEGGQPLHSSEDVLIIISSLTSKYLIGLLKEAVYTPW